MTRHFDNKYEWDEDEFGPKASTTLDDLVIEINLMTETHIRHP